VGYMQRQFCWEEREWHRLTSRWFARFVRGEEKVEGGAEAVLTASVIVELEDRIQMRITPPRFDRWPLLPDGSLDRDKVMQGAALAMDSILGPVLAPRGEVGVIHAESRFAHRRHQAESRFEPTVKQLALLTPALKKAGVAARLADLILYPGILE
jgi:hypothetical protein